MGTPANAAGPNPALIFDTLSAYVRTAALKAAIELDLFTAVGEGNGATEDLARRMQSTERGTRILCDYMVICGLLQKVEGRYGLTQESAIFLDRRSRAYMGDVSHFLCLPQTLEGFNTKLTEVVRKGGTVLGPEGSLLPDNPFWVEFAQSMPGLARMVAVRMAEMLGSEQGEPWKVLDIAAGHGLYGISVAERNPNARIVAVDWPHVLEVAAANARKAGVQDRFAKIEGSAFEVNFGDDYDLVLITNFLHHFDAPTCEVFLRRVHAALKPEGRAVTVEFVPNEDRVSPPRDASFAMMMLGTTPHGDAYTFAELEAMFRHAGFVRSELREIPQTPQRVVISYR